MHEERAAKAALLLLSYRRTSRHRLKAQGKGGVLLDRESMRFESAASVLPGNLRRAVMQLSAEERRTAEEIRLRAGQELSVLLPGAERSCGVVIGQEDLEAVCNLVTEFSRYAAVETLRQGYVTIRGGCRVGFCGTAVMKDGAAVNLKDFSSAVIRVAREKRGIADGLAERLFENGQFLSTLILAPPGGGKTTLLRELVRCISDGENGFEGRRIALVDERGEIAAVRQGIVQMDVGKRTDVLDGCPKAAAIPIMLRCMNPQILAVDEITMREDIRAMTMAANCGVAVLATIHASNVEELRRKPMYRELLDAGVFETAVVIRTAGGNRSCTVESLLC